jgi:D-glycero-D-manno-heptose 1,7-bisphosphate phosphatase
MKSTVNKCILIDRDGVLNYDRKDYAYSPETFRIIPGIPETLLKLKEAGYRLAVVTNQSGIAKGIYTREQMHGCHAELQRACQQAIDAIYYAPWHPSVSESLTRKPGSLMMERAMARFEVLPEHCWMVGDKERDLIPARKLGIRCIRISNERVETLAEYTFGSLEAALPVITGEA